MPPSSPLPEEQNPEGLPTPSEEDVQILYDIVKAAEAHEGINALPFRALFAAYDQVLGRRGIDTAHDRIYLRFLFRLGELRHPGQPLHEAFEGFLARLGIVLEFNEDDEDEIGTIKTTSSALQDEETVESSPARRSRRASFSSFISYEEETARQWSRAESRPESRSSFQDDSTGLQTRRRSKERPNTVGIDRLVQARRQAALANKENIRQPPARSQSSNILSVQSPKQRPTPKSPQSYHLSEQQRPRQARPRSPQNVRFQEDAVTPEDLLEAASSMLQRSQSTSYLEESDPTVTLDFAYSPNKSQLNRDADTFDYFRVREIARHVINKWRAVTLQNRHARSHLKRQAIAFDRRSLLTSVFNLWQSLPPERKQARETARFYGRLEKRAARARSLYVLTKAFTHWAQCAADEQARTSVARRHIIRLRYFNAWKDITAVNELKIRRFCLAKFFAIWKEKIVATMVFEDRAVQVYQGNLVEQTYWRWFWSFCGQRAPEYHRVQLKRKALARWIEATREVMNKAKQAEIYREDEMVRRPLRKWAGIVNDLQQRKNKADQFLRRQVVAHSLPAWQRQLKHAPIARQINAIVERRIVSTAFGKLKTHMSLEERASSLDRWRVLHNAWRAWNDQLRYQAFRRQVEDRIVVQALYKWVLAERGMLLKRLHEERLEFKQLSKLHAKVQEVRAQTQASFDAVVEFRDNQAKKSILAKWRLKLEFRNQQLQQSLDFQRLRAWKMCMGLWHINYNHQLQMEKWSAEASFYLRGTRTLKSLRTATTESRKQKLRSAYSQTRRTLKMNLARRVLTHWHTRTTHTLTLSTTALAHSTARSHNLLPQILTHWRQRLTHTLTLPPAADSLRATTLATQTLHLWRTHLSTLNTQHIQATTFAASRVERTAYEALRKLQLQTLERQARAAKASTVYGWAARRRARAFLRAWADRAVWKRSPSGGSPLPLPLARSPMARSGRSARGRRAGPGLGLGESQGVEASGLGAGTGAGESGAAESSVRTPAAGAGYLSTPSKRAARARAGIGIGGSYTPATAPRPAGETPKSPTKSLFGGTAVAPGPPATSTPKSPTKSLFGGTPVGTPPTQGAAGSSLDALEATRVGRPRQFETPLVRSLFRRNDGERRPASEGRLGPARGGALGRSLGRRSVFGQSIGVRGAGEGGLGGDGDEMEEGDGDGEGFDDEEGE